MHTRARWAVKATMVVALGGMLAGCDSPSTAPSAFAYDPTSLTAGQLYRWADGRRVNVYVVPAVTGPYDLDASVNAAISRWNAVPRGDRFTLQRTNNSAAANVIVFERTSPMPVSPSSCAYATSGGAGYTYICPVNGRAAVLPLVGTGSTGATTVLVRIDMGRTGSREQFDAVVTHELGHAVGIGGHSDSESDVMFGSPRTSTISGRDTQTLRWLLAQAADVLL